MAVATPTSDAMSNTDPTARRFRGSAKLADYSLFQEKLGEGTFGVVSKARSKRTGNIVALKKILMHNEKEGFPITALREVKLLKMLSHPNILKLEEMAVERQQGDDKGKSGKKRATLYMVMPYMDHDLSGMLTNPDIRFSEGQVKCYMLQLLEGLRYLHDSHILHRDMKAANLLISNRGLLQIADFGLARHYEGQTPQSGGGNGVAVRDYTSLVVTRWYRPPELLLTLRRYTPAIDMWGVGCVFGEMFERHPILEGKSDLDQCHRIFQLVGSPNDDSMPGWSELPGCDGNKDFQPQTGDLQKRFSSRLGPQGIDLLRQLLCLDWRKRINAIDALQHDYFKTDPLPTRPEDLPRYEDSHELDSRRRGRDRQRNMPPAPAGGTVGMGPDEWNGTGPPPGYGDRGPRQDRRGYPARYNERRPPPPDARPPRDRPRGPPMSGANAAHLPPRPNDLPSRPEPPARNGAPPGPPNGTGPAGGSRVDTYIPAYSTANPNDRPYASGRRGSRENAYRDPDAAPPRREGYRDPDVPRGNYRDLDAPRPPTREGFRERDWERDRPSYAYEPQRRTRSRSPERWRDRERDDARRERLRDREREMYRR